MRAVVVGVQLQRLVVRVALRRCSPARCKRKTLAAEDAIGFCISQRRREVRFLIESCAPLRERKRCSRIDRIHQRLHARNAEGDGSVGLNAGGVDLVDGSRSAHIGRIPVIAVDGRGKRLQLRSGKPRRIGVGIGVDVENVQRPCAVDGVHPIDLVQPPRQIVHSTVIALVGAIGAVPVVPPAACHRTEAHGRRIPCL